MRAWRVAAWRKTWPPRGLGAGAIFLGILALSALPPRGAANGERPAWFARFAREGVAADHALASAAGASILAQGGTAADAAAATMLALGVASPASSGLGGGGFLLYYRASDRTIHFLDFRETAPAAATASMYDGVPDPAPGPANGASQLGGLATAVPGEPAGIDAMVRRFGRLPLRAIVDPARRLALDGVPASDVVEELAEVFAPQLRRDPVLAAWTRAEAGRPIVQRELARTLEAFGREGARAIYEGRVARAIVAANRRFGGVLTAADLRGYRVVDRAPLEARAFGHRWVTAPPPSAGGFTMLASLAMLDALPVRWRSRDDAWAHALAESWKGPFLDRQRYFGDPDHVALPLDALRDPARVAARAALFHPALAIDPARYELPLRPPEPVVQPEGGGTSHLCVVDREGNVAAVTTTINLPFGARYTAAGIVLNDEMDDFARAVGAANAFGLVGGAANLPGPGKRPVSTMSPTIVFDDEGPVLCIGAAGGSRIVTATEQVALAVLARGRSLETAIAAPRVHHQARPNTLETEREAPLAEAARASLRVRGHVLDEVDHLAIVQAMRIVRGDDAHLEAASDPRKGGVPAGE